MESISNGSHCNATPQVSAMAVHLYQYSGHHQQQYSRHHLSVMSNALEGSFPKCSVMQNRSRQLVPSSVDLSGYNPCDYVLSENLRPAMFSNHPNHGTVSQQQSGVPSQKGSLPLLQACWCRAWDTSGCLQSQDASPCSQCLCPGTQRIAVSAMLCIFLTNCC